MYSFRMSFCSVPESWFQSTPCFSATARYMAQITGAGELMVIDTVTSPSGMPRNRISMSSSELMDTPHLPTSPSDVGVIGVVAHERRQIEGHRKSGLSLAQQIKVAAIGFFRSGESRELPHGPELAPVHAFVNAARVGKLARRRNLETGDVSGCVDRFNGDSAERLAEQAR